MKKRLLSMLMAVLMIASLVPATALADTNCKHDYQKVSIDVDVKTKTPGVTAQVCSLCGEVKNVKVTPFAAKTCTVCTNLKELVVSEASCSQPGLTITYCGDCGKMSKLIPAEGKKALTHEYKFFVAVKPTCTTNGWGYAVCQLCNEPVYVDGPQSKVITNYVDKADQADIKALYTATKHVKDDALVAVTENVYDEKNPEKIVRYAGVAAKHNATVGLVDLKLDKDGNFNAYGEVPDAAGIVATMVCPDCDTVVVPKDGTKGGTELTALNIDHEAYMQVTKKGQLPAVVKDSNGNVVATEDGWTDEVYCAKCKDTVIKSVAIPYATYTKAMAFGTAVVAGVDVKAGTIGGAKNYQKATCIRDGYTGDTYVWTETKDNADMWGNIPGEWVFNHKGDVIPKTGHSFAAKANVPATCEKHGVQFVGVYECAACGTMVDAKDVDITAAVKAALKDDEVGSTNVGAGVVQITPAGAHSWTTMELAAPTCYSTGLTVIGCEVCKAVKDVVVVKKVDCVAADELANVVEATCTEAGYTGDTVCKWCGKVLKAGEVVPAAHKTEIKDAKAATCTEAGYTGDEVCTVCNETIKKGEEIPALGHKYENGVCTVCGEKEPVVAPEFKDAASIRDYAKDAVTWAAKEGIVKGDDNGNFLPTADITRQDFVTMLWRLKGSVASEKALTFGDKADIKDYAQTAVAWAVENGYIKGRDNGNFDPAAKITRAEIVAILNRIAENAKAEKAADFTDIATHWAKDAIAWAAEAGIVNGVGNNMFAPNDNASRQDTVVMLYKFVNLK